MTEIIKNLEVSRLNIERHSGLELVNKLSFS